MEPLLEQLLAQAFGTAPAREANQAIASVRRERARAGAEALSYELILPGHAGLEHLVKDALPRLIYFLDCRGVGLPQAPGVFVSLFAGETLHFLEVAPVLDLLCRATGLTLDELVERHGAGSV